MKTKQCLLLISGICVLAWISAVVLDHLEGVLTEDGIKQLHERSDKAPYPDDKLRYIHWFLQISDIHISKFWDPKRAPDLKRFCTENVDVIRPEVVMATGDLTDAKHADFMGSDQFPEEWHHYYNTLVDSKVLEKTVWLDIKGNHDAFNVPSLDSHLNYFSQFSAQGGTHRSSYRYVHKTPDGQEFSFIGVDATPNPGVRRPFNFFGVLSDENLKLLSKYGSESRSSNMSIWFGHYPSSTIANPGRFRQILSAAGGSVYLCGHLHTLQGLASRLYVKRPWQGNLELELADWKDLRMYRLMAVDHDMFSFTDVKLGAWPIVLITNPKDAQFITPSHEASGRMSKSTHIRILVFSPSPIKEVKVTLDGIYIGSARPVEKGLFVLPWQPKDYASGLHNIRVDVKDEAGRTKAVRQLFTLDNTKLTFDFWRRLILLSEQDFVWKVLFGTVFMALMCPLIAMKLYARTATVAGITSGNWVYRFIHCWFRRIYLLAQTPSVFWPLMFYHLYVALGPWFVGHLMEGHLGVMFVFGLYVKGTFIPALLTLAFGLVQLVLFNIPLTCYLARTIDVSVTASCRPPVVRRPLTAVLHHLKDHGWLYVVLWLEAWFAYTGFYKAYGIWSLVIGPVRTWSIPFALVLQQMAIRARSSDYRAKYSRPTTNGASGVQADS